MKIAYVTTYDATDRNAFGGRGYYMARSLNDQSTALEYIGPLEEKYSWLLKSKEYIYNNRVVKKRYTRERDRLLIMDYARQISRKLSGLDVDVIFSPMSLGSQPVAYLECKQPIVIWTDATFAGALDFYPHLRSSMLCKETISAGIANERAVLNRCDLAIYWSEWAAQTAIEHYQIDPAKVKVVPVGPNLECHRDLDDIRAMVDSRPSHTCKLLFLGMEWHRKGGDIAFEVAKELNNTGLNTELTVVGCQPLVDEPLPSYVKSLGYINKSTPEGAYRIDRLLAEAHFLILPSRAEAFGMIFCEASSFGVPSLTAHVGGIPTAVRDGVNGKTFSSDASIEEYCMFIAELFSDYAQYKNLALASFHEYRSRLNWSVAGQTVKHLLNELLSR